jgi:hypothetical protein
MTASDIVVQPPSLATVAVTILAGAVIAILATVLVVWVVLGMPTPAKLPGPWWKPQSSLAAIARCTVDRARRLRAHNNGTPQPDGDKTVPLPRPRAGQR